MSEMIERINAALTAIVAKTSGCYSERCCCHGVSAFECKTDVAVEELTLAAMEAMREHLTECARRYSEQNYYAAIEEIEDALK